MNTITVIAHGDPNSFARQVQHDPTIAVEVLRTLAELFRVAFAEPEDLALGEMAAVRRRAWNLLAQHASRATP